MTKSPELTTALGRHQAALSAEYDASRAVISTPPATIAGLLAVTRYVIECEKTECPVTPDDEYIQLLSTISAALEAMTAHDA